MTAAFLGEWPDQAISLPNQRTCRPRQRSAILERIVPFALTSRVETSYRTPTVPQAYPEGGYVSIGQGVRQRIILSSITTVSLHAVPGTRHRTERNQPLRVCVSLPGSMLSQIEECSESSTI